MANLPEPNLVEQTSRTVHNSTSGIEIIRTFYVEPYAAHQTVQKALQGFVADGERTLPAHDPYITNCFCVESRAEFADINAMASSPSLEIKSETGEDLRDKLQDTKEAPQDGTAGAIVTAHFRPLITAWESKDEDDPDDDRFDWLDPQFSPSVRQIPWPDGLFVATTFAGNVVSDNVPAEVASPLGVTVTDFSIRRTLVDKVPWKKLQSAANAVNRGFFPTIDSEPSGNLPRFEPQTLRFVGAIVENMLDVEGNRYYEITLNFEWIQLFWDKLFDRNGNEARGWVTWNHVFMQPWWLGQGETGWYQVSRGKQRELPDGRKFPIDIPGFGLREGRLYNEIEFMPLFDFSEPND
jgi:hypothetical protein